MPPEIVMSGGVSTTQIHEVIKSGKTLSLSIILGKNYSALAQDLVGYVAINTYFDSALKKGN